MNNKIVKQVFLLLILLAPLPVSSNAQMVLETIQNPDPVSSLISITNYPAKPADLIAATNHQIFIPEKNHGWKSIWKTHDFNRSILKIMTFASLPDSLFILSEDGLYEFCLSSQKSRKIFGDHGMTSRSVFSFLILPDDPEHWFVGTSVGVFESDNAGATWHFMDSLHHKRVSDLVFDHEKLFAASNAQIYLTENLTVFTPVFSVASPQEVPDEPSETETASEETSSSPKIVQEIISGNFQGENYFWAATTEGVFESLGGKSGWRRLPQAGLLGRQIHSILYDSSHSRIFAATDQGIFAYDLNHKQWTHVFPHENFGSIKSLALTQDGTQQRLVVLSDQKIVSTILIPEPSALSGLLIPAETEELFGELMRLEPSVLSVQKQVIRANHLGNGKINRWHAGSRLQALVPTLSFSKNLSTSRSIDLDRGGTNDPDRYILGPDDTSRSVNASVNWNLGEMIWSSSQTSIDSRDKINAEFRNDLLSQVTQLYFERRRLQQELVFKSPGSRQNQIEQLSRVDELTALIDAMTSGFFSRQTKKIYRINPELLKLWNISAPADKNADGKS